MAGFRAEAVGSARLEPGRLTTGELLLADHIAGPIASPVMVATGAQPGPVLWVQGAIHGEEVGGTLGIARALNRMDPATMRGAVVGVLTANPLAFRAQQRNTPQDGENMNRVFPGAPAGALTRQMAHALFTACTGIADAALDFHSGGVECVVPFYGLHWEDGSPAARRSGEIARAIGADTVWTADDTWLSGAMAVQLVKRGIPAVIVECGGGGAMPEEHVEAFGGSIEGAARALGILPGAPPRQKRLRKVGSCDLVFSGQGGFFVPDCAVGASLQKGDRFGHVIDAFGVEREVIRAHKPSWVAAIGRNYLPVHSGALIGELNDELGWEDADA
jgi:predicted deacylase